MDDPWEWLLVSVERRPLGNVASGLVLLVAAFAVTALSRWVEGLAGGQGDVLVIVVAGWLASLLAFLALSALSMPAYFGRRRALSAGAFTYVVLGLGVWAWALEPLNVSFPPTVVWPYFLATLHGCFLDPALWPCPAA